MIDINILRENPKIVEDDLRRRQRMDMIPKLKELIDKDTERRKLIGEADALRAERNKITAEIAKIKKTGGNADHLLQRAKDIPERVKDLELRIKTLEEDIRQLHLSIPNILHPSVPDGKDDKENVEIRDEHE
jgi:seryl-tRNA synthetase